MKHLCHAMSSLLFASVVAITPLSATAQTVLRNHLLPQPKSLQPASGGEFHIKGSQTVALVSARPGGYSRVCFAR